MQISGASAFRGQSCETAALSRSTRRATGHVDPSALRVRPAAQGEHDSRQPAGARRGALLPPRTGSWASIPAGRGCHRTLAVAPCTSRPFGSQPRAATAFFNSASGRLRFLCDRVERSGANCSMKPQIRVRQHAPTRGRAASICRVSAPRVKQKDLQRLWEKFDAVRGNERTTKPRSARLLGRTG
jgi:hypothetical protein